MVNSVEAIAFLICNFFGLIWFGKCIRLPDYLRAGSRFQTPGVPRQILCRLVFLERWRQKCGFCPPDLFGILVIDDIQRPGGEKSTPFAVTLARPLPARYVCNFKSLRLLLWVSTNLIWQYAMWMPICLLKSLVFDICWLRKQRSNYIKKR